MQRHGQIDKGDSSGEHWLSINKSSVSMSVSVKEHHTLEVPSGSGGLSIKYSKQCPISSNIASFQQIPLRCGQNLQLRGDHLGPRNKTTMMLRRLPTAKNPKVDGRGVRRAKREQNTKNVTKIKCPQCPRKFQFKAAGLSSHLRAKHGVRKTKNSSPSTSTPTLLDEVPPISSATMEAMEEAQVEASADEDAFNEEDTLEESGGLPENSETEEGPEEVDSDAEKMERDGDEMICKLCNARFGYKKKADKLKFEYHMEMHYGQRPFVCPFDFCDAAFKSYARVMAHSSQHTQEYNFECAVCSTKFKNKTKLEAHNKKCKPVESNSQTI